MREQLTPKQVARALEVSESSVKRWCDRGLIPTQYTAGGHRRIALSDLLVRVRDGRYRLVHPEALGLPPTSGRSLGGRQRAGQRIGEALLEGAEQRCRQIVFDLVLADQPLAAICDEVLAEALCEIGHRWEQGEAEVYQERRACEIVLRILHELRTMIPAPPEDAPEALGGTMAGDRYVLGTTMVELVLREAGWKAISLGDNLPASTLAAALQTHRPSLFWLSCSHIPDETAFLEAYQSLYQSYGQRAAFVVGGNALTESLRGQMQYASYCDKMQHLASFANSLQRMSNRISGEKHDESQNPTLEN